MGQTIGEFVERCAAYPYSEESFQMHKECAKLALINRQIENYNFIKNSPFNEDYNLPVNFFQESTTSEYEALMEEAEKTKASLKQKIKDNISHIIKGIVAFASTYATRHTADGKIASYCLKQLRATTIEDKMIDGYMHDLEKINKHFPKMLKFAQPFNSQLNFKYDEEVDTKSKRVAKFESQISLLVSDSYVIIDSKEFGNKGAKLEEDTYFHTGSNRGNAIGIEELITLVEKLVEKKETAKGIKNEIQAAEHRADKEGVRVTMNDKKLEKMVDRLKALEAKAKSMFEEKRRIPDDPTEYIFTLDEAFDEIRVVVANTLTLHNDFLRYRHDQLYELKRSVPTDDMIDVWRRETSEQKKRYKDLRKMADDEIAKEKAGQPSERRVYNYAQNNS